MGILRDQGLPPRKRLEPALRASIAVQGDATHRLGCMLTLSAPFSPGPGDGAQVGAHAAAAAGRACTREVLRDCLQAGVDAGELAPGPGLP